MHDEDLKTILSGGLDKLDRQLQELSKEIKSEKKKKDIWDKISAISPLMSGVVVASVALYFTLTFNARQNQRDSDIKVKGNRINELEAFVKYIPLFATGSEREKKLAVEVFIAAGYDSLANRFTQLDQSPGAVAGIAKVASVGPKKDREMASKTIESIFSKYQSAVVQIVSRYEDSSVGYCAGVLVSPNGHILTTAHTLEGADSLSLVVKTMDGRTYQAKLLSSNKLKDLAVLKIKGEGFYTLSFTKRPALNEDIIIISYVSKDSSSLASGKVTYIDKEKGTIWVESSSRATVGMSGAVVVDTKGSLIGVLSSVRMIQDASQATDGWRKAERIVQQFECVLSDVAMNYLSFLGVPFFAEQTPMQFGPVYFEVGSSSLDMQAKTIVDRCAKALQEYPYMDVTVIGYKDDVPLSLDETEMPFKRKELPRERAIAIKDYLLERGISVERISIHSLAIKCPEGSQGEKGCCIIRTH